MFRTLYIASALLFAVGLSGQQLNLKVDQSIEKLLVEAERSLSQDITKGSRIFVMTPRFSAAVPPYVRDRVGAGLIQSLAESKFVPIYQPFLEERTNKRIESSDTALRIIHSSSLYDDYASMRALVDTLEGYAVDLLLVSRIHQNESEILVLNIDIVDAKTLQIESSLTVFSSDKIAPGRDTYIRVNALIGNSPATTIYRDYPQLTNGLVGPFEVPLSYQALTLGVHQDVLKGREEIKFGISSGYESTYLQGAFNDSLYQVNQFNIDAFTLGVSLEFSAISKGANPRPIVSLLVNANVSKPTLFDNYFSSDTRLTVHFTRSIGAFFQVRFTDSIVKNGVYTDVINNQSYMLCYGASIHI